MGSHRQDAFMSRAAAGKSIRDGWMIFAANAAVLANYPNLGRSVSRFARYGGVMLVWPAQCGCTKV